MPQTTDIDLRQFIDSIPSPEAIQERMARNTNEQAVLRRLLRLSIAAENERAARSRELAHV